MANTHSSNAEMRSVDGTILRYNQLNLLTDLYHNRLTIISSHRNAHGNVIVYLTPYPTETFFPSMQGIHDLDGEAEQWIAGILGGCGVALPFAMARDAYVYLDSRRGNTVVQCPVNYITNPPMFKYALVEKRKVFFSKFVNVKEAYESFLVSISDNAVSREETTGTEREETIGTGTGIDNNNDR